jgi:hypothetical protein
MKQQLQLMTASLVLCAAPWVSAQTLATIKAEPAAVKAGEATKLTLNLDVKDGAINCGVRLHLGDGNVRELRLNKPDEVPAIVTHTYAKAGNYTVRAEGKKVGGSFKCSGQDVQTTVAVAAAGVAAPAAAAPAAKPAAPAASAPKAAVSTCPAGWALSGKVNTKTKAFTCTAKAGTAIPEPKLSCPGDLTYFENSKKGQLGCRP